MPAVDEFRLAAIVLKPLARCIVEPPDLAPVASRVP
jgi:hypothetical protein